MTNIFSGFEQAQTMRTFSKNMRELLEVVEDANSVFSKNGDNILQERVAKFAETVSVIEETEQMMLKFQKNEITLDELATFRDRVAAMRPNG